MIRMRIAQKCTVCRLCAGLIFAKVLLSFLLMLFLKMRLVSLLQFLRSPSFLSASFRSAPIPGTTMTVYLTVFDVLWGLGGAAGVDLTDPESVQGRSSGQGPTVSWFCWLVESCRPVAAPLSV